MADTTRLHILEIDLPVVFRPARVGLKEDDEGSGSRVRSKLL